MKESCSLFCCIIIILSGGLTSAAIGDAIDNLPDVESLPQPPIATEQLMYFEIDESVAKRPIIQQAIVPQLQFTSHGTITSFSALTVLKAVDSVLQFLPYVISFTIWRPRGLGLYDVVGHNVLKFRGSDVRRGLIDIDNSSGLVPESLAFFKFTDKEPVEFTNEFDAVNIAANGPVSFQAGDILGWTQFDNTLRIPLSLVYIKSNTTDAVNGFSLVLSEQASCSVSECDVRTSSLSSIIPYFSVKYTMTAPPNSSQSMCIRDPPDNLTACTVLTTQTPPTITSTTVGSTDSSPTILIIAAPIVVVIGVLLLLIALTTTVLLCCKAKKRERYLVKLQAGKDAYQLEDNPRYDSAGDIVHTNDHHQSADRLHFECEDDGGLYAIPTNVRPNNTEVRRTANLEDIFDGDCYASTYQSNGQCHIYQELPETNHRMRSMSMVASHDALNRPRPALALRITASSASVSRFPYTMPNTPALSVFDLEAKPSFQGFPYTESTPSVSYSDRKLSSMASSSHMDSRPSGSSFLEKPSISTLPYTPEDTPPSSATIDSAASTGHTVRKLFHAVDDELIRVPNAMERQELKTLDNPDEMYSRLKHSYSKQNRDSIDAVFLDQPDQYWAPPSDPTELYDQLAKRKFREIQRKQIRVTECIGSGNFGTVHKGLWQVPGGVMPVAVKTLNPNSPGDNEIKFLKEAAIMGQFLHTNVVKLLGVVTVGEPLMIVLELMPKGDLKQYLKSLDYASSMIKEDLPSLLLSFCRQIGYGMNYLANKAFVHRDLAARNILLAEDLTCKIGDFGMSRDLEEETVYFSQGGKLPLRWTAPEALKYHQFSSASDVWSYGMLLFEIWSLGKKPFDGILTNRLMSLVSSGFCQPPPPGCPRTIYKMMVECWHTEAERRITFAQICSKLNSSSSVESLLGWTREDSAVSARAWELGAPLSEARRLYIDLQFSYTNSLV